MEILPFLLAPFLASLILTGIHAYLGVHVVERGVIFVDLVGDSGLERNGRELRGAGKGHFDRQRGVGF